MEQIFTGLGVVALTAIWTFIDRKFPSSRVPGLYREKLWQNVLVNFVLVAVIYGIVFYVLR